MSLSGKEKKNYEGNYICELLDLPSDVLLLFLCFNTRD